MTNAWLCDGVRTPIGRYGKSLATVRPDDLGVHVIDTLIDRNPHVGLVGSGRPYHGLREPGGRRQSQRPREWRAYFRSCRNQYQP